MVGFRVGIRVGIRVHRWMRWGRAQVGRGSLLGLVVIASTLNCGGGDSNKSGKKSEATGGASSTGGADSIVGGTGGNESTGGDTATDIPTGGTAAVEDPIPLNGQLDLLFVIDNSISMADKQEMLFRAVPDMIELLVNPPCISESGQAVAATNGACPVGSAREFAPLDDIHIGVITSSLGGHGSDMCLRSDTSKNNDDRGRLLPSVREGLPSSSDSGFLTWNGGDGEAVEQLITDFAAHVGAVGDIGCGYEAPLEAWYRFLVDPQPPAEITLVSGRATAVTDDMGEVVLDETILAQREAFLRPESLINIVVLTDENDCSAMDGGSYYMNAGFGYLTARSNYRMRTATSVCDTNPNDTCCFSCLQTVPAGCEEVALECEGSLDLSHANDRMNVRCFEQKRRFGFDLLYPVERYLSALRDPEIVDARNGEIVPNPLLTGAGQHQGTIRPAGRVYFTGIVGVPWQDVVTQESLDDPDVFEYLTGAELATPFNVNGDQVNRWDVMLGKRGRAMSSKPCQEPDAPDDCGQVPVPPLDPFMIESIAERTAGALNPLSGDAIVASSSNNPQANSINGHEVNHQILSPEGPANDDLQYACIFPLDTPKTNCFPGDFSCDCGDEPSRNSPLCQPPGGGAASTTQYYGKAYPGIRILEVLRDFGENAIVGSICPKDTLVGYTPTMSTIVRRMKEHFPPSDE
jgi:hypothetical protein